MLLPLEFYLRSGNCLQKKFGLRNNLKHDLQGEGPTPMILFVLNDPQHCGNQHLTLDVLDLRQKRRD